ncbi:MAG: tetratricopeptide repeat protein [Planctomycetota bacterium]
MMRALITLSLTAALALPLLAGCRSGDPSEADASEPRPRPASSYRTIARAAFNGGRYEDSIDSYEQYLRLRPTDAEARYELGRVFLEAGRPGSAREQFTIAYESDVDNEVYIDALANALAATGDRRATYDHVSAVATRRNTVDDFLRVADVARRFGDVDKVEDSLLTAAALDRGQRADVQIRLSDFYGQVGDSKRQIRRLRMAYFIDQKSEEIIERATALGEIIGPSWRIRPAEKPAPRPSNQDG